MSSIDRPVSGAVLRFSLAEERKRANDPAVLERQGRAARTLVKEGALEARQLEHFSDLYLRSRLRLEAAE